MNEVPATELEAVNIILINMGETPVDSLSGDLPLDAYKAQQVLHEVSREAQNRGWVWNREIVTLPPNSEGKIPVPQNTLSVERYGLSPYIVERNGFLYRIEKGNNGYEFEYAITVTLTLFLPFSELPSIAKEYIFAKASRVFQARELGDDTLLRQDTTEERIAWARLRAEENVTAKRSLKQARDTQMITDRMSAPLIWY